MTTTRHPKHSSTHTASASASRFTQAFDDTADARAALPLDSLRTVNVDMLSMLTMVLGALPQIRAHKLAIGACPATKQEQSLVANLEAYTFALSHANTLYRVAAKPEETLSSLIEEGAKLRESLRVDAAALAAHGVVVGARLADIGSSTGYRQLASDLFALAVVFREVWPKIDGKTLTQVATIDRAEAIAEDIMLAVGAREQAPAVIAAATVERQRAFTLFERAYDQTRRALTYVRWNEADVEEIAPSIYSGRGNGNHRKNDGEPAPAVATPASPVAAPATPANGHAHDLPGGSPFVSLSDLEGAPWLPRPRCSSAPRAGLPLPRGARRCCSLPIT